MSGVFKMDAAESEVKMLSPEAAPGDEAPAAPTVETVALAAAPSAPNEAPKYVFLVFLDRHDPIGNVAGALHEAAGLGRRPNLKS